MKGHRFTTLAALILAAGLGMGLWLPAAVSQEDMKEIKAEAFSSHTRPAAVFVHDKHNEKAELEDCVACHHGKDDKGNLSMDDNSAGTPCAECHAVDAKSGTPLMRAYHQQCISCHRTKSAGPTHCGGCHAL